jgi:hydrogenase nickel incorporation protein HypA/HybF
MHETGLVRDLIRRIGQAAEANGAERVVGVQVRLGALSHLSAAHFREHFEAESRGTPAEGARLIITESTDSADPQAQQLLLESLDLEV